MALLNRDDWYDIARDVDWTLSYVDHAEAFPEEWVGAKGIPLEAWDEWDEPFRVSYREYVMVQREKEASVSAIREAMVRAKIYKHLDAGHQASSQLHMGTTCMVEQTAVTMQSRFCRFAPTGKWRSLGAFGMMDETRHTQLDMRFSHDLLNEEPRFDWCQKAFHTNEWGVIAVRNFFDDIMLNADCVEAASRLRPTRWKRAILISPIYFQASRPMKLATLNWASQPSTSLLSTIQSEHSRSLMSLSGGRSACSRR
jgi:Methane/Phenol/Alkene Hydroxylase